jgi:hypothetical protein
LPGFDPAIHLVRKTLVKMMDTRVKPAYDDYPGDNAVSADMNR